MIDITLLGTAALMPLPERALSTALLTCSGHSILFDCGEGTQTAARKAGISIMKVDIIALTHYHGDHIFGLPGLLQTMYHMKRTVPLYIAGPSGLKEELAPILKLVGQTSYDILLLELPEDGLPLSQLVEGWPTGATLSVFKTEHRVPSQGYCFTLSRPGRFLPQKAKELGLPITSWKLLQNGESVQISDKTVLPEQVMGEPRKGLKIVFTGDTSPCNSLTQAAKGADLLICDATYGENEQEQLAIEHGHMNFAQAARTASDAGASELWLTHYSQMIKEPHQYLSNATSIFANTIYGYDGMQTTLRFDNTKPN